MQKCLDLIVLGAVWYLDCTFHRHMKAIDFIPEWGRAISRPIAV